ncbi:hypothetical protein [Legionella massiliensis]|uniref:hypothetical protein n=1 Tax=Legionella massiliensis TaxID=1034943 RepID=UPI0005C38DA6|nr:hypothetical protein [Legionella massiliensis]
MINFWHEILIEENKTLGKTFYIGIVRANSDVLMETDGFLSINDAQLACEYFIRGIKFARENG